MDVQKSVDELRLMLERVIAEEELLSAITERLVSLRQAFPANRSSFTPDHIEFLQHLTLVANELRSFIEVKDELANIGSVEEHGDLVQRLINIKDTLAPFAVGKRVMKKIRELHERPPAIRQQSDASQQFRLNALIIDVERDAPKCRHQHAMVIREAERGYFWGCSRFPDCWETAQLTVDQTPRLTS